MEEMRVMSPATTTAEVAKYLEREDVKPFTMTLVALWQTTGMDISILGYHLQMLMSDVAAGSEIDLREVDWEALAERYA